MANPFLNPFLAPQMAADATDPNYLSPEEEDSLTRSLLRNSMGLLEAVGYALDTPGAYLRGALSGRAGERRSGREMLTDWGVTSANDPNAWEAADFAGIGADILFDPLTYMTFGAGALSKAGKAVRAAGGSKQLTKIAAKKIADQTGGNAGQILKTLGPRRAKMMTTLEDAYTYGDDALRQNLDKVLDTKQLNKTDLLQQELGGLFGLDVPFTGMAKAVGTGETAQTIAGGLDVAAKTLAYAPGVRHIGALFDPEVKGSTRASIQKNLRENANELELAAAAGGEVLYGTIKNLGDAVGDNRMVRAALDATPDQLNDPEFFSRLGINTPTEEQLKNILPLHDIVQKQYNEVIDNGGDIAEFKDEMNRYFPSTRLDSNFAQGQDPQGLIAGGMRELPITSTYSKHREEVFNNLPGRSENIRFLTTSPEVSGPKSKLTKEEDRVDFIFNNTPGIKMMAEDAAEAEGMALDELVAATKTKLGEINFEPKTNADKAIAAAASKYGYMPSVVKKYAQQQAELMNAEKAFDASVYPETMRGMLTPSAWKAIKNVEKGDVETLQRAGIPMDLIGERLAEAGLIKGDDFSGYAENALDYLKAKGSPYAATKKGGALDTSYAHDPKIIDDTIAAFSDAIAEESANIGKLSPTEQTIAGLLDKSKQLSKYLRNTSPEYSKFAAEGADTGLTSTHVAKSLADYVENTKINVSMLKAIIGSLADEAVDVPKQGYVPVEELMQFVGLGKTVKEGEPKDMSMAMERFVEALGRQGKSANSVYVPADIAQDITKLYEKKNEGWFLKGIDKATSLIKSGLTMAPAFHVRNRTSGMMQSILDGALSFQSPAEAKRSMRTILTAGRIATGATPKGLAKNRFFQSELGANATDEDALSRLQELLTIHRVVDDQYMDQIAKAGSRITDPEKYGKAKVGDIVENKFTGKENLVQSEGVTRRGKQVRKYPEGALEATVSQPDVYQTFGGRDPLERAMSSQPLAGLMTIKDVAKGFASDVKSGVSDLIQPMRAKGTFKEKASVAAQNFREGPLNPFNIAGVRGEASRSAVSKVHERFGRMVEVNNRVEAFLGLLDQGVVPAEAAARVRSMQIDYSKLSPFERSTMRRVMPFYTFTRRFSEHLAKSLMERPGGGAGQVIKVAAGQRSDDSFLPDYVGEGIALPNPLSKDSYVTGLGLALEGPLGMGAVQYKDGMIDPGKSLMRTAQKMSSNLNPMLRGPIELMTGRSLYTGRPLQENWQYPIMNPQSTSAVLANALLANSPASRWITTSRKLSDERKTIPEKALNLMTGISTTNLSGGVENAKEFQVKKAVDELLKSSPRIRSYEATYVPQDMKDKLTPDELKLLGLRKILVKRAREAAKKKEKEKTGK